MSVETTNTPNGASKDLYSKNKDKIDLNYIDCNAMGKEDLSNWQAPGDGIEVYENKTINVNDSIKDNGSISIRVVPVGQPMISSPEATSTIKENIKQIKEAMLKRNGVISSKDYINYKIKQTEKTQEDDKYENDKNHDGIDDRNQ